MTEQQTTGASQLPPVQKYHHGQSPAAWAGVIIAGIGFLLATVASMMGPNWTLIYIAGGLVLLSLVVASVLFKLGYGNDYADS